MAKAPRRSAQAGIRAGSVDGQLRALQAAVEQIALMLCRRLSAGGRTPPAGAQSRGKAGRPARAQPRHRRPHAGKPRRSAHLRWRCSTAPARRSPKGATSATSRALRPGHCAPGTAHAGSDSVASGCTPSRCHRRRGNGTSRTRAVAAGIASIDAAWSEANVLAGSTAGDAGDSGSLGGLDPALMARFVATSSSASTAPRAPRSAVRGNGAPSSAIRCRRREQPRPQCRCRACGPWRRRPHRPDRLSRTPECSGLSPASHLAADKG